MYVRGMIRNHDTRKSTQIMKVWRYGVQRMTVQYNTVSQSVSRALHCVVVVVRRQLAQSKPGSVYFCFHWFSLVSLSSVVLSVLGK